MRQCFIRYVSYIEDILMGNMNQRSFGKQEGLIAFPKPCTLCESRTNVTLNFGLWVCGSCVSNIRLSNPDILHVDHKKLPINL